MAKQQGGIEFTGRIGKLVFYNSPYGVLIRSKGSLNKKRLKNDPNFQGSRNAGDEFGRASKGGARMRAAVKLLFKNVMEYSTHHRLNQVLAEAVREEKVNVKGKRM